MNSSQVRFRWPLRDSGVVSGRRAHEDEAGAKGDEGGRDEEAVALSGLKNELRKQDSGFSEKSLGYSGFLQFVKAAAASGYVDLLWDDETDDYVVSAP